MIDEWHPVATESWIHFDARCSETLRIPYHGNAVLGDRQPVRIPSTSPVTQDVEIAIFHLIRKWPDVPECQRLIRQAAVLAIRASDGNLLSTVA